MAKKKRSDSGRTERSDSGRAERSDQPGEVDFESALAEVEKVVANLESGELGLSESLAQYERGIEKIKLCHQVLERAEKRISILMEVDQDGNATVEPVGLGDDTAEPDSETMSDKPPSKRAVRKRNPPPAEDIDDTDGLF